MLGRRLKIVTLFSLLALVLNSCTLSERSRDISFDGVEYALYFSPPSLFLNDLSVFTPNHGYVVLVDAEGKYQTIKTDGMDGGEVRWGSADELSFVDRSYNYIVRDKSIVKFEAPKTDLQNDMAFSDGVYISTFNKGGKRGEYENQFTVTDVGGMIDFKTITESVESLATCPDGRVIGGGLNRGPTLDPEKDSGQQIIVSQIYDGENLAVQPLWNYTNQDIDKDSISYFGLVCTATDIHLLIYSSSQNMVSDILLASVDLVSGQADIKPLISDVVHDNILPVVVAPSLYEGRYLDWFTYGDIYRTDIITGETKLLIELEAGGICSCEVDVDEEFIYKLVKLPEGHPHYAINRYDRVTGSLVSRLVIDPIEGLGGMGQYGFAARPSS